MKKILLATCILLTACFGSRRAEIQVKSTYVTVIEIQEKQRFGQEDRIQIFLQAESGIHFLLEAPISDTIHYPIGRRLPFLAPR